MKPYISKVKSIIVADFASQIMGDTALAFLPLSSKMLFDTFV